MNIFKKLFGKQNSMRVANIALFLFMFCSSLLALIVVNLDKESITEEVKLNKHGYVDKMMKNYQYCKPFNFDSPIVFNNYNEIILRKKECIVTQNGSKNTLCCTYDFTSKSENKK